MNMPQTIEQHWEVLKVDLVNRGATEQMLMVFRAAFFAGAFSSLNIIDNCSFAEIGDALEKLKAEYRAELKEKK